MIGAAARIGNGRQPERRERGRAVDEIVLDALSGEMAASCMRPLTEPSTPGQAKARQS